MGTPNSQKGDKEPEVQLIKDLFRLIKPVMGNISRTFRARYSVEDDFPRFGTRLLELICRTTDGERLFVDEDGRWWLSSLDDDPNLVAHVTLTQTHPPDANVSYDELVAGVRRVFGQEISKRKAVLKSLENRHGQAVTLQREREAFLHKPVQVESLNLETVKPGQVITARCTDRSGTFTYRFDVLGTEGRFLCNMLQTNPSGEIVGPARAVLKGTGQWTTDAQNPVQRGNWFTNPGGSPDKMLTIGWGMLHVGCSLVVTNPASPKLDRYELQPPCSELWLGIPPAN